MTDLRLPYQPQHVYVSSHRRGFFTIVGYPMVTDGPCGTSGGTGLLYEVQHVEWNGEEWVVAHYANPRPSLWTRKAFDDAVALTGPEPWRIYKLNAAEVAKALDNGAHIDDIRGFELRLEKKA